MESRVAKYLNGNRVPMSGSGSLKGDCYVPYDEYRTIYIECKLTQSDVMRVPQTWLEKIEEETLSMRCVCGILVIHFVGSQTDYCFISEGGINKLQKLSGIPVVGDATIHDHVYDRKTIPLSKHFLKEHIPTWIKTQHGLWLGLHLASIKSFLDGITKPNEE